MWERDLGTRTEAIANEITEYDPDDTWTRVDETALSHQPADQGP